MRRLFRKRINGRTTVGVLTPKQFFIATPESDVRRRTLSLFRRRHSARFWSQVTFHPPLVLFSRSATAWNGSLKAKSRVFSRQEKFEVTIRTNSKTPFCAWEATCTFSLVHKCVRGLYAPEPSSLVYFASVELGQA